MTGQEAYQEDCRRQPHYQDGAPRPAWDALGTIEQGSWERNPTPRAYPAAPAGESLEARYATAADAVREAAPGYAVPELAVFMDSLRESLDEGLSGGVLAFSDFPTFFDWWCGLMAYESADNDDPLDAMEPLVKVAYEALVDETSEVTA